MKEKQKRALSAEKNRIKQEREQTIIEIEAEKGNVPAVIEEEIRKQEVEAVEKAMSKSPSENKQVQGAPVVPAEAPKSSVDLFNEIISSVNPKDLEKAEAIGFPIKKLMLLMGTMTTEIQQIAVTIPNVIKDKMNEAIKEAQDRQKTQIQATPEGGAPQSGGMLSQAGDIMGLISKFAGGGGGDSELTDLGNQFAKQVLTKAIADVTNPKPSIAERVGEEVLLKFAARKAAEAVEAVK